MGKVDAFEIFFQKPNPIYFGGEIIHGHVHIRIKERLKINKVDLIVKGGANVYWTETHSNGQNTVTVAYHGHETYINQNIILLNKLSDADLFLEVGDHSFPFEVVLPSILPTSFEHTFGQIRYSLQSNLDIPWAFDKHTIRSFTVLNKVDLNLNPSLRQPHGATDSKTLCCGPCKSDPIIGKISIEKTGFVPGETMILNASIDNKSKRSVKMSASLMQTICFHATNKSRSVTRKVSYLAFPNEINEKSVEYWNNILLKIPPVISSSNGSCRIIEVFYSIIFNVNPSGPSLSMDIPIPIVIGTVPLYQSKMESDQTDQTVMPTFALSTFGQEDSFKHQSNEPKGEIYQSDQGTYQPIYPYYKDFSAV